MKLNVCLLPGPHDDAVTDTIREGWHTLSHSPVSPVLCFNCSAWWYSGMSFILKCYLSEVIKMIPLVFGDL